MVFSLSPWKCSVIIFGFFPLGSTPPSHAAIGVKSKNSTQNYLLKGGTIIDVGAGTMKAGDIYICDGFIVNEETGKKCSPIAVDVQGRFLIPGLIDAHVHARGQGHGDQVENDSGDLDYVFDDMSPSEVARRLLSAGVTGFLDVMNDEQKIFPARDSQRIKKKQFQEADIFCTGGAFTPTSGHGTEYGLPSSAYRIVDTPAQAIEQVRELAKKQPDSVKIFYDHRGVDGAPDVKDGQVGQLGVSMKKEVMQALINESKRLGLKSYVHIGSWNDARDAIEAGADLITHLGESTKIPVELVEIARKNKVSWVPTLALYHDLLNIERMPELLDDPLLKKVATKETIDSYRPARLELDPYYQMFLNRHQQYDCENVRALHQAGIKILAGTDTPELGTFIGWTLHRELKLLQGCGLSSREALASATILPGEFLGRNADLNPGSEANILVLTASPLDDVWNTTKIEMIVHRGTFIP